MDSKTIKIVVIVALVAAVLYFVFFKKKAAAATATSATADSLLSGASTTADDKAAFNKLIAYFKANVNNADAKLHWMLPEVQKSISGETPQAPDYNVNGKLGLTGAFVAIYARAMGQDDPDIKIDHTMFHKAIYKFLEDLQDKAVNAQLGV